MEGWWGKLTNNFGLEKKAAESNEGHFCGLQFGAEG